MNDRNCINRDLVTPKPDVVLRGQMPPTVGPSSELLDARMAPVVNFARNRAVEPRSDAVNDQQHTPDQLSIYNAGKSAGRAEAAADLARLRAERDELVSACRELLAAESKGIIVASSGPCPHRARARIKAMLASITEPTP